MKDTIPRYLSWLETQEQRITVALCVFVIMAGAFYSFALGDALPYIDARDYYALARNLATQHSFSTDGEHPTAWRAPGYPFFLSLLIRLGADIPFLRFLNFVALAASIYMLRTLVGSLVSPFAGLVAAVLVLGYPVLFYAAGTLFSLTIGSLLFVCILFLLTKAQAGPVRAFLPIGVLFGCLILTMPAFLYALALVLGWVLLVRREAKLKSALALALPAVALISLWTVRNYLVFHSFVLVTTNLGSPLLMGNSEYTTIGRWNVDGYLELAAPTAGLNEVEREAYFMTKAIEFITEDKVRALKLYGAKFVQYFHFRNTLYAQSESTPLKDLLMLVTWGPLLVIFFIRLLLLRRFHPSNFELLLIVLYFGSAFFYALFLPRIRYRLPFDFLLLTVVAMFIGNLVNSWFKREALDVTSPRQPRLAHEVNV